MKSPDSDNEIRVSIGSDGSVKFGPDALAGYYRKSFEFSARENPTLSAKPLKYH
jgi:hypothetical protein